MEHSFNQKNAKNVEILYEVGSNPKCNYFNSAVVRDRYIFWILWAKCDLFTAYARSRIAIG